ncbi:30S ribosomal protein S2 [Phycisphaerales bacterium AB-hyl4]|uniref:Small ribosomal subunit protein uS2 n=1 Tax=Natronomicrosphaera hydrolytica TaxID=3242702 RepID=A0ABV4U1M3_9BACT
MASLVKDLVEAGIHFGHRATNWNPKMAPYIFGKRNKIHIIDVKETIKGLLLARKFVTRTVAGGKDILFVGTKRQARAILEQHVPDTGMHYVTERWLGGTLTNFRTIRERLKRLEELEKLEESGEIANYSKKMEASLNRERDKIQRNLGGLRNMTKLPGAMVIIDVGHEHNAVKEARKLGIPTVCLIDTDSNPDFADIPIPGNDDAIRAIDVIVSSLCAAVMEGKSTRAQAQAERTGGADDASAESQRRRSRRAQFRAEDQPGQPSEEPAESPDKMGSARAEGDSEKAVTSAVGQADTTRSDRTAPPQ